MMNNRITRYRGASSEGKQAIFYWSDFVGAMQEGIVTVKGCVRIEMSEEGEYRLNIVLCPEKE